jgi:ZIP family zinc transporter
MTNMLSEFSPVTAAFLATSFTWLLTAIGASSVFFFNTINRRLFDTMLGFAGGVMIAASFWSLLAPAIEMSGGEGMMKVVPAVIGFLAGGGFLHINFERKEAEGIKTDWHGTTLLVLAITLHNIPEGLAVGVMFGGAAAGIEGTSFNAAIALAIGIGIQNLPEGLAVAFPLRRQGLSRAKSFWFGQLSAIVEPIAGVLGALLVVEMRAILPFAAGAMIYVVVEEVIPETQKDKYADSATLGCLVGFALMMALDVGLS